MARRRPLFEVQLKKKKITLKELKGDYMKNTRIKIIALAAAGVLLSATSALAGGSDSFNRPHLGPKWTIKAGSLAISNHEMVGATLSLGSLNASSRDTAASAVVILGSTDLEYGAVALGNIQGGNNAFVKIQSQNGSGTTFDTAGFYNGNNIGGVFFTLASPVPSPAIVDVFFCGTTATMRITSAAGVQTYTNNYTTTYGTGAGLGTFGSVRLDNFIGFPSACTDAEVGAMPASSMPPAKDLAQ
jgi:hypothetical protein